MKDSGPIEWPLSMCIFCATKQNKLFISSPIPKNENRMKHEKDIAANTLLYFCFWKSPTQKKKKILVEKTKKTVNLEPFPCHF